MLIGDLFERDVTRTIPPVVYFHEQDPAALEREVSEYIITSGPDGIHEQFVRLLTAMKRELGKAGGTDLPACWISGFYGSGKSSFAKLLGLSLDGRTLPSGKPLADALLLQDRTPEANQFALAWHNLVNGLKPIAIVFDVGSRARDDEHIHAVVVRELQHRLGYSKTSHLVAEYELKLEIENLHGPFMDKVLEVHGKPWGQLKDNQLAEDYFSAALHALQPQIYPHEMSWVDSRSGSRFEGKRSADEAVTAIQQMLAQRCPGRTLFIVVDEVSQYVHEDDDRMLALQSFVAALGQRMKGQAWLLATGQQKLEEGTGVATAINKLKDRFPSSLRVHLGIANIRDVVHKRLLRKKKQLESELRDLFHKYRSEINLYAYEGAHITDSDFIEVYPMLPGHIPLLLDITTGLRSRSSRTQGDSHAIRGLLQLLGDLFRDKGLARYEIGALITVDLIYDVLHSALDADIQATIVRALELATKRDDELMAKVVKAVAMLELAQNEKKSTTAELVARCLYAKLGQGSILAEVQAALDTLVGEGLLAYSEKSGYRIESTAGQDWQRERDGYAPGGEQVSAQVSQVLSELMGNVEKLSLNEVGIPWLALYSDSLSAKDVRIKDERKYTVVTVDFQFTKGDGRDDWVPRTGTPAYRDRIVWVAGDIDGVRFAATKAVRSARMIERYAARQSTLQPDQQRLLVEERNRFDSATRELTEAVKAAFLSGHVYFRGREYAPLDAGSTFRAALSALGNRFAGELYPHPFMHSVAEKDVAYLIDNAELAAPPPILGQERLGILTLDAGRYEVTCTGRVPREVLAYVKEHGGVTGSTLLSHFGSPPHGFPADVLRATVIGLLRGGKVRVELPGIGELTSVRDEGARELLKETGLRKAKLVENTTERIDPRDRNAICLMFKNHLGKDVARDNDAIADAVATNFVAVRGRLTSVAERFRRLPKDTKYPDALKKLEDALEACRRDRRVEPTVLAVKRNLTALLDGFDLLRRIETELTDAAAERVSRAEDTLRLYWPGLSAVSAAEDAAAAAQALETHLRTERPWEDSTDLEPHSDLIRGAYRAFRKSMLDTHAVHVEQAIDRIKRKDGFDRLDADQRHIVLRHLREGAAATTDETAIAPALEALEPQLAARLESAEAKALAELDVQLEKLGVSPTVEVALDLGGREIRDQAELERVLDEIRKRVLHALAAGHRVRLK